MQPLKEREREILTYILQNTRERGYAPSVRDICEALDYRSTSTVQMYLDRLLEKGFLRRESGKSRSLRVVDPYCAEGEGSLVAIPLISSAEELVCPSLFPYLSLRASLSEGERLFAFRLSPDRIAILLCGGSRADRLPPIVADSNGALRVVQDSSTEEEPRVGGLYATLTMSQCFDRRMTVED